MKKIGLWTAIWMCVFVEFSIGPLISYGYATDDSPLVIGLLAGGICGSIGLALLGYVLGILETDSASTTAAKTTAANDAAPDAKNAPDRK